MKRSAVYRLKSKLCRRNIVAINLKITQAHEWVDLRQINHSETYMFLEIIYEIEFIILTRSTARPDIEHIRSWKEVLLFYPVFVENEADIASKLEF